MPKYQPLHHDGPILFDTAQLQQIMESADCIRGNDEVCQKELLPRDPQKYAYKRMEVILTAMSVM